jgi:putative redox protein
MRVSAITDDFQLPAECERSANGYLKSGGTGARPPSLFERMDDKHCISAHGKEKKSAIGNRKSRINQEGTMTLANVLWTDNDRFVGQATSSHAIVVDAAKEKTGNSPMELVLIGLCGCTASDVLSILRKKREPFTSLEVTAQAERAENPPSVYTQIRLTYRVEGKVSHKAMEDAVRLSEEKYCSVASMLNKTATITYQIEYGAE